ncbi:hypothetical protein [Listeria cornellensis]|uniref:Uncharacterized protein n=1 Tax=Listeria cornellensis FSL F6-0969 TaxID=1265820 RepID=W7CEA5_9LIST|nr:hypothetical protein [Listeria cornellensis]EUJ31133.1 hypothetical protein PCORN_06555 [Listeria cornellensis FSL F6-0969]
MDAMKEMRFRFHVLGYFLVAVLFVGAGLMLGASGVSESIVVTLFSFTKYMILSFVVGVIGIWRAKELSSRLFFIWLVVIPVAYVLFLIMVVITRAHP